MDGLHEETGHVGVLECLLQGVDVVVGDDLKPWGKGPKSPCAVGVGRESHDGGGPAVEIVFAGQDLGLSSGHALHIVGPFAGNLDGGFYGLCARVHGQHLVVPKVFGDVLLVRPQHAVVESTGGERQLLRLLGHGPHDAGVAVSLVDGAVGAQEIIVALALDVPAEDAFGPVQHYRQGMVVVRTIAVFHVHGLLGGSGA